MKKDKLKTTRRRFLKSSAAGVAALSIVPRNVLGQGQTPPSGEFGGALIGCGGRGGGTFGGLGPDVRRVALCDVKFKDRADNKMYYSDFRRLLERKDVHVVAIATPPGWHALISIAAMEAGKDVLCEKPMTRFIAEGRAVAEAERRYNRIYQIGTYGRFGANQKIRKIFESGLLNTCDSVYIRRGGVKVKEWSGKVKYNVDEVPANLDWDFYCGATQQRPYNRHRTGGTHRGYWDHEGGGLSDMSHHHLDGPAYQFGRDLTSPVEITPYAPPMHPEACGLWGWCEMKYADGFTIVLESGEWGEPYDRLKAANTSEGELKDMLAEADRKKLDEMPDLEPLVKFPEAIRTRKQAGGHAAASHRVSTIYHLANVAFRCGRKLRFDPETDHIVGDEEADRLVNQPVRAPWRL
ncbi:MAG: Gfo/Idh/MocA family oxidoreductase [Candidatus Nealsonbacteria bacterium]|nr:Gfo/Idh/MocA family oxidoreductase [Candidatus Nealsonbacteria bacterium]